ncbi:hypothetical protein H072_8985 [Dactylellina haptotyla CBS 200.50]|uniref:Uncharacterized protein n=1 Tax=Dactylellina haptotyla (strain CBS 200.50) TaxID=1284197 RepID=S8A3P1_DACHA|nr:hypothetical protein H072_8985 [Dactylellina haptotyla CBS 200.50]
MAEPKPNGTHDNSPTIPQMHKNTIPSPPSGRSLKRKFENSNQISVEQIAKRQRKRLPIVESILNKIAKSKGQEPLRALRNTEVAGIPSTPANKMIPDPVIQHQEGCLEKLIGSTETDRFIQDIVEEQMQNDPSMQNLNSRSRKMIMTIRRETERKKIKLQKLREKRSRRNTNLERWDSFRCRLERDTLPGDKRLRGPSIAGSKRASRFNMEKLETTDTDVQDILARWGGSAVAEEVPNAPESPTKTSSNDEETEFLVPEKQVEKEKRARPRKPRYKLRSEAMGETAASGTFRKEKAKGPFISKVQQKIGRYQANAVAQAKSKAETKKEKVEQIREDLLEAAERIKRECLALKERSQPPLVGLAKRAIQKEMEALLAAHKKAREEFGRLYDKVAKMDQELLKLRDVLSGVAAGEDKAFEKVKGELGDLSATGAEGLKRGQREKLRKQQKRERRALGSLQGN